MDRKIIALATIGVLVLTIVLAIAPTMATPAQQIPVKLVTSKQVNSEPVKSWTSDDGILHEQGIVRTGVATLTIDGQVPLVGTEREVIDDMIDKNAGTSVGHSKLVLTFTGGTFEGVKQTRTSGGLSPLPGVPMVLEQHTVLQGTGAFEGQTMMLTQYWEYKLPLSPPVYVGTLIIH